MDRSLWLGFIGVSLLAVLTPGPTLLAILGHAAASGFRATLPVVLGNAAGIAVAVGASMAGVAGALSQAPTAFLLLQLAGASYLAWHGALTWRRRREPVPHARLSATAGPLSRGFLLVWSNPKALLFFGAVLPQFVRGDSSLGAQFLQLATTFIVLELAVTTLAAAGAGRLASAGSERTLARVRGAGGLVLSATALVLAIGAVCARHG